MCLLHSTHVPSLLPALPAAWSNYLSTFLDWYWKPKGYFLAKQMPLCGRNVSWNLGKAAALRAVVLQHKGQRSSSECIRSNKPGQMPARLRLSARKDLLPSKEASKWRTAKALGKGDGVQWPAPKAWSFRAPWWIFLQEYDLNAEPPSFTTFPWVKRLPQPRQESRYLAGQVSSEEHSCLLYHQDVPLLKGKEELHDQVISSIVCWIHLDWPFPN